jgi:hypothetical protein
VVHLFGSTINAVKVLWAEIALAISIVLPVHAAAGFGNAARDALLATAMVALATPQIADATPLAICSTVSPAHELRTI